MTTDFFKQLQAHSASHPDHLAFQILGDKGRESYTYKQVIDEVSKIGTHLQQIGIGVGDTVGILMENHPRWGIAFLAAQSVGARIVPFDILHLSETLANLIQHSECKFLISSGEVLPKLEEIQAQLPARLPGLIRGEKVEGYGHWETVLEEVEGQEQVPLVERDATETLLIVYTSGTTGNPKGVMLTRRNIFETVGSVLEAIELRPEDHFLSVLPLYHMLALLTNFVAPLYVGATTTYLESLDAQKVMKAFRDEGITIFVCVPQFFYLLHRRILQQVDKQSFVKRFVFKRLLSLSHFCNHVLKWNAGRFFFSQVQRNFGKMRIFGVGGARFDKEIINSFHDLGFNIIQAYGMTETSAVSTTAPQGVEGLGTVGRALDGIEIKIDQPDEHGIGEVLIKGINIMQGYWKNPEATEETLKDGWLHSGDLGFLSPSGLLEITGRTKDVIVLSSGKNIFPEEIEGAYERRCPFIQEMCVIGVEDTSASEEQEMLHAVIVPDFDHMKRQKVVNAGDMIRYMMETISQKLPPHKRVRSFEIRREPLPRTTTRKIKRFEVQEEVGDRPAGVSGPKFTEETPPEGPIEEKVFEMVRKTGRTEVVNREMSFELDCGFDSLERVEFLSNVQDIFGIQIADDDAIEIFTVKDLVGAIEERLEGSVAAEGELQQQLSWKEILAAPLTSEEEHKIDRILRRRPIIEIVYYFLTRILLLLSKLLFRMKVEGLENLPKDYPFMICPNHLSFIDGFIMTGTFPLRVIRRLFFLGYSDYFGTGMMSFLGSLIKVVPVDPDRNLRQALRLGAHGLDEQLVLCIFPEGERSIDGTLRPFKKGPSILAAELTVPVVPVAILGTYEVWRRGSDKISLHPITVRFGTPLIPESGESSEEFNERLFEAVDQLIKD